MKNLKIVVILFTLLFSEQELFAQTPQWSAVPGTTTDIHYSNGKVGIGTSTPATLFEISNGNATAPSYFRFDPFSVNPQIGLVGTTVGSNSTLFGVTSKRAAGQSVSGGSSMMILEYDATSLLPQTAPNRSSLFLRNDDVWNGYVAFSSSNVYDPNGTFIDYQSRLFEVNGNVGNKFARTNLSTQHADHYRWEFDGVEKMRVNAAGRVGIGTITPNYKLDVSGKIGATNIAIGASTSNDWTDLLISHSGNPDITFLETGAVFDQKYWTILANGGRFRIVTGSDDQSKIQDAFQINRSGIDVTTILFPVGNVGIGTSNPGQYKLAVEGKIGARAVKVTAGSWADYVFEKDYQLKPLSEVESFINENKHLPEVPSTIEVKKDGIDVAEMDALLLKKIEELTLYIIELKKEVELLKKEGQRTKE